MGHGGSSVHRHGDTRSWDPTHSWLSIRPPVCQNPATPELGACGSGLDSLQRVRLAKLQASGGSLKGNGFGAAGRGDPASYARDLGLCPSQGHGDLSEGEGTGL